MSAALRRGDKPFHVYRLFDEEGTLLYVGMSMGVAGRLRTHTLKSWGERITTMTIEWFATRHEARTAESLAIATEAPLFNIDGGSTAGTSRRAVPGHRRAQVIAALRQHGPKTQVELEKLIDKDLGRSFVGMALLRLVADGLVHVVEHRPSNSGRWSEVRVYGLTDAAEVAA